MKGGSAPLRMAWEPVSGLPVSTHSGRGRLMCHARMKGQTGERGIAGTQKGKVRTGENCWHESGWCLEDGVLCVTDGFQSSVPTGIDESLGGPCRHRMHQDVVLLIGPMLS